MSLALPSLPKDLEGLRVLHVSDLHVRRVQRRPAHLADLLAALEHARADVVVLTGDYMNHPGDEPAALEALHELVGEIVRHNPDAPVLAIRGNHDTRLFERAARLIPGLRWLADESVVLTLAQGARLRVVASGFPENLLAAAASEGEKAPGASAPEFTIALVHYPTEVFVAARLGLPLVLSGHTHAGQIRPWPRRALHTSCDLPARFAAGIFRLGPTTLCVSRGLGTAVIPFRFNCPAQAPLYVLRRSTVAAARDGTMQTLVRW